MKLLCINGSPRKNFSTASLLGAAIKGAESIGASHETINLYDYKFKGCISCLRCKRKGNEYPGICRYQDDLTQILKKALDADVLIMGAPVYFSHLSAGYLAFMERLLFPIDTYMKDPSSPEKRLRNLDRTIYSGLIVTMNCPNQWIEKVHYDSIIGVNQVVCERVLGHNEILYAGNTYQFDDYGKYDCDVWAEEMKAASRKEEFPVYLKEAEEMAVRLLKMAEDSK